MVVGDDSSSNSDWRLPTPSMSCFWRSPGSVPLPLNWAWLLYGPAASLRCCYIWREETYRKQDCSTEHSWKLNFSILLLLKVPFKVLSFKWTTFKVQCDTQKPSRGCSCIISHHIFNNKGESHSETIGFGFRVCCSVTLISTFTWYISFTVWNTFTSTDGSRSVCSSTTEMALHSHD